MGHFFSVWIQYIIFKMGRVRTKTVKKAAKLIIEKYYTRLTLDFHVNKRICEEIAIIPSKPLRNKIAGFVTHLMKRLQHKTVRGISIKLQEEERERRDNYVPETSVLDIDTIEIDVETKDMLKIWNWATSPNFKSSTPKLIWDTVTLLVAKNFPPGLCTYCVHYREYTIFCKVEKKK